ncbi:MAG: TrbL/VirB6 plasmid conjugal transfer protein [Rickettsiaceae bacterium]|nr:TrbL/VirB6 plasmid conjugal transfer protein [Rickettsiaceae bacterium]
MLGFLLLSFSSCNDQGCIEADDFGEYDQEILNVPANNLSESCDYQADKEFGDQGSGLKVCLMSGNVTIVDDTGDIQYTNSSGTGCSGTFTGALTSVGNSKTPKPTIPSETPPSIKQQCIEQCRVDCINKNSADVSSAEPNWTPTHTKEAGKNMGVTLTPGSKIFIRAIGTVTLGGDRASPIYVKATDHNLQSGNIGFNPSFIDLQANTPKNMEFSGSWVDNADIDDVKNELGDISTTDQLRKVLNGARRLVLYTIPHPEGYQFDISQNSETNGTKGTPLFADDKLWSCNYDNGTNLMQSSCQSLPYSPPDYPTTDNSKAQQLYSITSAAKADNLGLIGGMIRWTGDGLVQLNYDPFTGTVCDPDCSPTVSDTASGGLIGDLSSGKSITNSNSYAVRVSFRNLSSDNSCNLGSGTIPPLTYNIESGSTAIPGGNITIDTLIWSDKYIALEPGDKLLLSNNSTNYTNGTTNCGRVIAYRLQKLQDIKIEKSGFLKFTMLGISGTGSENCSLKGRIINPDGSRVDSTTTADFDEADFYEYDSFETVTSNDPLSNLTISTSTTLNTSSDKNWTTQKIFVRKGQVIRFDPESWNGTWTAGSNLGIAIKRQCGIGMAMKIEERPAFLCRGNASVDVPNPSCKRGMDNEQHVICMSNQCLLNTAASTPTANNAASYCPNVECVYSFNDSCASAGPPAITEATCRACKTANGTISTTTNLDLIQCYDLENYRGKVSNIPPDTGFTGAQLSDDNISKGAKLLSDFNGQYGNFSSFADSGKVESTRKVYTLNQSIIPEKNSRLKFLVLDGKDFTEQQFNSYSNNSSGPSYNGSNGYKISLSGKREFQNGQWLEAILCQEDSSKTKCSSVTIPTQVASQPNIVTIENPTVENQFPKVTSYYQFDPFGSILRFNNVAGDGVNPSMVPAGDGPSYQTEPGVNYYRHSYDGSDATGDNSDDAKSSRLSNLRISFKIKDPDIGNCNIANPVLNASHTCPTDGACDGIIVDNIFYDAAEAGTTNRICGGSEEVGAEDSKCHKQYFCASKYYNNSGQYQVVVRVENKQSTISKIADQVISPVVAVIDGDPSSNKPGQAERIYTSTVGDPRFQAIVEILIILMISFYGLGYLMGVSEFSQTEILTRIIKIGIVYLFISPTGWYWFERIFVSFFKDGTNYVTFLMASSFDQSAELQNAIALGDFSDKSILFGSVDKVFGMFFSSAVQKKISAFLFASIFGWAYLYIIYLSFFIYVYAVANAILLYLAAQVLISILFVMGPLFFLTSLFNQTKDMFDKWLGELIGLSLQQVFLLTTLAFFNMMVYEVVKMALGYRICWDDVWVINLYFTRIKLLSFWTIASIPPNLGLQSEVGNIGNPEGIPSLFSILFIYVIATLMGQFIGFMTDLGASIGGSVSASSLSSGIKDAAKAMNAAAKKQYQDKIGKHTDSALQSADRFLFDSGKKAEEDRKKTKEQDKKDTENRNTLAKAGEKGVDDYKKKNAADLAKKSPAEQEKMLQDAKKSAMMAKAKEMGMDDKEASRLIGTKAKMRATTAADMAKQAWKKGGNLSSSLADKDVKTSLSGSQIKSALKNAETDEERQALRDAVKKGDLTVGLTRTEKVGEYISDEARSTYNKAKNSFLEAKEHGIQPGTLPIPRWSDTTPPPLSSQLNEGVAKPIKSAWDATKSSFKRGFASKEYAEARGQLEQEGAVDKMSIGTRWAASDTDKQAIADRIKANKLTKTRDKTISAGTDFVDKIK